MLARRESGKKSAAAEETRDFFLPLCFAARKERGFRALPKRAPDGREPRLSARIPQQQGHRGKNGEIPTQRLSAEKHSPAQEACLLTRRGGWGLGAEVRALVGSQGEDWGWRREHSLKGLARRS